jgi:hypothetical protein
MQNIVRLITIVAALILLPVTPFQAGLASGMTAAQPTVPEGPQGTPFWSEDFSAPLAPENYYITATPGSGILIGNAFLLTLNVSGERGRIFYRAPAWMYKFVASFSLYLGQIQVWDMVADGAAFIFCPSYDYPPDNGGSLDASCPGGYIVGFDTFEGDAYAGKIYVALGSTADENRICQTQEYESFELADGEWHTTTVSMDQGNMSVTMEGSSATYPITLNCVLPGYQPFNGYFGFSAATGDISSNHQVDNINIELPFPRTYLPLVTR